MCKTLCDNLKAIMIDNDFTRGLDDAIGQTEAQLAALKERRRQYEHDVTSQRERELEAATQGKPYAQMTWPEKQAFIEQYGHEGVRRKMDHDGGAK